jgi:hypothetical protein
MKSEFRQLWRFYTTDNPEDSNSHSALRVAYQLLRFVVLWSVFLYISYRLIPRSYWPFFRGVFGNPFFLLFLLCLFIRKTVIEFLSARVEQGSRPLRSTGVLDEISALTEYRQKYGRSDFFYTLYVSIGWVGLGSLMIGGLYWFFSLPKIPSIAN